MVSLKKIIWAMLLARLKFNWKLRSGLEIQVRNYGDWTIYNEIFVNSEYDLAIMEFVNYYQYSEKDLYILDLGSNVGFFTLRLCDLAIQNGINPQRINLTLVEADKRCLKYLEEHIKQLRAYPKINEFFQTMKADARCSIA